MARKTAAKRPDQFVAEQVRIARESLRLTQSDLAARLRQLGFTQWHQSKVAKIENGEVKRLTLDDVLALAAVLEVQPVHLLVGDGDVEIAPKVRRSASEFREWVRGSGPLHVGDWVNVRPPTDDERRELRTYFTGALVPDDEFNRGAGSVLALTGAKEELSEWSARLISGDLDPRETSARLLREAEEPGRSRRAPLPVRPTEGSRDDA